MEYSAKNYCKALGCNRPCSPMHIMCEHCQAFVSPETRAEIRSASNLSSISSWTLWWKTTYKAMFEVALATPERFSEGWDPNLWLEKKMDAIAELETRA